MYEYAATAIGPRRVVQPSFVARKIDVGPSAPPMMEIAAAALSLKSTRPVWLIRSAPKYAAKIPN